VDVQLLHGLSGGRSIVDADVEAIWVELGDGRCASLIKQGQQRASLLGSGVKEGSDVPSRDQKAVTA